MDKTLQHQVKNMITLVLILLLLSVLFFLSFNIDTPVVLEDIPPDRDTHYIITTGYDQLDVTKLNMQTHRAAATTPAFLTNRYPTAKEHLYISGKTASEIKTSLEGTDFLQRSDGDANTQFFEYLSELHATAYGYIFCLSNNVEPSISSTTELAQFFSIMKAGLMDFDLQDVLTAYDGDPTANVGEMLDLIAWKAQGADTDECHYQWVNRWLYALAVMWRPQFPKMNEKFENMTNTQINKLIYLFISAGVTALYYMFLVAAVQSDRAMFSAGYLDKGMLSSKVPDQLATAINNRWAEYVKRNKSSFTVPTSHTAWTTQALYTTGVTGQTLEDSIGKYIMPFKVPDIALKLARQMFGIGQSTAHNNTVDFAVLMDLLYGMNSTTGALTRFGVSTETRWALGYNTAYVIDVLDTLSEEAGLWTKALTRRRHWTYDEVEKWAGTIWADFSIIDSLNGLIENDAYKGIRATVFFSAYAHPLVSSKFSDPTVMVSTNDMKVNQYSAVLEATYADKSPPSAPWVYPYIMQSSYCDRLFNILLPNISDNELIMWIRYGMLLSRTESSDYGSDDKYRIWATRTHLVDAINNKDEEIIGLMSSDGEQIRFSSIGVPGGTHYSEAEKHTCTVYKRIPSFTETSSAARPASKGEHLKTLKGLPLHRSRCQQWLSRAMLPPVKAAAPAEITPPQAADPPTEKSDDDNDDE